MTFTMRTLIFTTLCLAGLFESTGYAQSSRIEAYGGYSFVRQGDVNLHGWSAAYDAKLRDWVALDIDLGGNYAGHSESLSGIPVRGDVGLYTYLFGPKFTVGRHKRWTPFFRVLAGGNYMRVSARAGLDPTAPTASKALNGFATAAGTGLDLNLSDHVALRVAQGEYRLLRINSGNSYGIRLSFGIVFKFE